LSLVAVAVLRVVQEGCKCTVTSKKRFGGSGNGKIGNQIGEFVKEEFGKVKCWLTMEMLGMDWCGARLGGLNSRLP